MLFRAVYYLVFTKLVKSSIKDFKISSKLMYNLKVIIN
jgi:hypothetical protein